MSLLDNYFCINFNSQKCCMFVALKGQFIKNANSVIKLN